MFRRVVFTMFVLAIIGCDDKTAVVEPETHTESATSY